MPVIYWEVEGTGNIEVYPEDVEDTDIYTFERKIAEAVEEELFAQGGFTVKLLGAEEIYNKLREENASGTDKY
jgi:hypothetical protein